MSKATAIRRLFESHKFKGERLPVFSAPPEIIQALTRLNEEDVKRDQFVVYYPNNDWLDGRYDQTVYGDTSAADSIRGWLTQSGWNGRDEPVLIHIDW